MFAANEWSSPISPKHCCLLISASWTQWLSWMKMNMQTRGFTECMKVWNWFWLSESPVVQLARWPFVHWLCAAGESSLSNLTEHLRWFMSENRLFISRLWSHTVPAQLSSTLNQTTLHFTWPYSSSTGSDLRLSLFPEIKVVFIRNDSQFVQMISNSNAVKCLEQGCTFDPPPLPRLAGKLAGESTDLSLLYQRVSQLLLLHRQPKNALTRCLSDDLVSLLSDQHGSACFSSLFVFSTKQQKIKDSLVDLQVKRARG